MSHNNLTERAQTRRALRLTVGMIGAKICCMVGSAAFASTLVELTQLWHLDSTHAGWISSAYLLGYTLVVPILVGVTDRIDARAIYLGGCVIGAVAFAGFAYLAHGLWSAFVFQALAGISLAGAYIPGLRVLTQRLEVRARIQAVPYYTGAFGIGTSLSFLISGWAAAHYGWRASPNKIEENWPAGLLGISEFFSRFRHQIGPNDRGRRQGAAFSQSLCGLITGPWATIFEF